MWAVLVQTCLPQGQYCDVISGNIENGQCTGKVISVGSDGRSSIFISSADEDPMIAINVEVRIIIASQEIQSHNTTFLVVGSSFVILIVLVLMGMHYYW